MSGAYFRHTCPVTNTSTQRTARWTCKKCGQRALFAGMRSGMVESWGAYRRRTGIASFGPHRPFADQLLREIDPGPCPACGGRGAIDPDADDHPLACLACDGSGRAPYAAADLARVQAQVRAEWPPERIAEERRNQAARFPARSAPLATPSAEFVASLHLLIALLVLLFLLFVLVLGHGAASSPG